MFGSYLSTAGNECAPSRTSIISREFIRKKTGEASRHYKVKPPSLNADLFEQLLGKTNLSIALQASLVRGWREGFMLSSSLPNKNHFVRTYVRNPDQEQTLRSAMMEEKKLG